MPPKSKAKKYGRVQRGQPRFASGQLVPGSFSFGKVAMAQGFLNSQINNAAALTAVVDVSSPTGSLSLLPKACEADSEQANWAGEEMGIGVTDDGVSGLASPDQSYCETPHRVAFQWFAVSSTI
jgi:hypothetical protein